MPKTTSGNPVEHPDKSTDKPLDQSSIVSPFGQSEGSSDPQWKSKKPQQGPSKSQQPKQPPPSLKPSLSQQSPIISPQLPPQTPPASLRQHLPKSQKSSRSIRSTPLPPNHVNYGTHPSYHRQYVLLREKNNQPASPAGLQSPALPSQSIDSPQLRPKGRKPKRDNPHYVFSVDDDEDEVEEDLNREIMETSYNETVHSRQHQPSTSQFPPEDSDGATIRKMPSRYSVYDDSTEIEEDDEFDEQAPLGVRKVSAIPPLDMETEIVDNYGDNESVSSNESFTLRERQDAINETHPFGIRIWKPAVYKKHRSVETEADNDIHSTPQSATKVHPGVKICNALWSVTFGLLLFVICLLLGAITAFFSACTNSKVDGSMEYAKLYYHLGLYFLNPFGKIVVLSSDENYLQEDAHVGTSVNDFRRWRAQNEGRLFFSTPSASNARDRQTYGSIIEEPEETSDDDSGTNAKFRLFGRGQWNIGRVIFFILYYIILFPITCLIAWIELMGVFSIPMSKILVVLDNHLRWHPLALQFELESEHKAAGHTDDQILICTYRSFGMHYYKYTIDGTNVIILNLLALVLFTIVDFYVLKEKYGMDNQITDPVFVFVLCLLSTIPLAYFIGQAVASISAQTSMGLGAVINAFFSTIVEVFLYCVALNQSKGKLVEGSIIGSILGAVLLLPGLSMCSGALKRKTQRYNPASAGVSSTMLLYAILVMFSPSFLYEIFGKYEERCESCEVGSGKHTGFEESCRRCHYLQPAIVIDRLYLEYLRPYSIVCVVCLFLAYCIGLLFTLKTHAKLIWSSAQQTEKEKHRVPTGTPENQSVTSSKKGARPQPHPQQSDMSLSRTLSRTLTSMGHQVAAAAAAAAASAQQPETGGHDAPNWSRTKSTTILLLATVAYAVIAEILVDVVDDVITEYPIDPKFLGLTVFALVPNTTEFINAISFAMHGNVALSMEIGSAYALQVCLLQIPIVAVYSHIGAVKNGLYNASKLFTLIFPRWDCMACLISVYMFTYIYAEGKSNYFKGSILILLYMVVIVGFYVAVSVESQYTNAHEVAALAFGKTWEFTQ